MSQSTRITLVGFLSVFVLTSAQAHIAKADPLQDIVNNFSHENLICGAYSLFVHQCLKNKDSNDKLAGNYFSLGDNFIKRGVDAGKAAGVSEKAIGAKIDIAIEDMKSETDNDCINISILYKTYARTCKILYEDGPQKFADDVKRHGAK